MATKGLYVRSTYTIVRGGTTGGGSEFVGCVLKTLAFLQPAWLVHARVRVVSVVVFRQHIDEPLYGRTLTSGREQFTTVVVERVDGLSLVGLGQCFQFFVSPIVSVMTLTPTEKDTKSVDRSNIGSITWSLTY